MISSYTIFAENLSPLVKLIAKMNKKAVRLGLTEIQYLVTGKETRDEDGLVYDMLTVEIGGETPKLNGWSFLGTIAHAGEAGNILRIMPGFDGVIPERFRTADPSNCDHCHMNRRRIDTYIVMHDDGTFAQVGSSCLQDFVRSDKVGQMASLCEMMSLVHEAAESYGTMGGRRAPDAVHMDTLLTWTAEAMFRNGWTSRTKAREFGKEATVDVALRAMDAAANGVRCSNRCGYPCDDHFTPTDDAHALATKVLEWAPEWIEEKLKREQENDYIWNMHVVFASDVVTLRAAGLAASILSVYQREMDYQDRKRREHANITSEFIGTPGSKYVASLTVAREPKYLDNDFGVTTVINYTDEAGNIVVWFASGHHSPKIGDTGVFEMTVKGHTEWQGIKQTQVQRVKPFIDDETKKANAKLRKAAKAEYERFQREADRLYSEATADVEASTQLVNPKWDAYTVVRTAADAAYNAWKDI